MKRGSIVYWNSGYDDSYHLCMILNLSEFNFAVMCLLICKINISLKSLKLELVYTIPSIWCMMLNTELIKAQFSRDVACHLLVHNTESIRAMMCYSFASSNSPMGNLVGINVVYLWSTIKNTHSMNKKYNEGDERKQYA